MVPRSKRLFAFVLALASLVPSSTALAWDAEAHKAILEIALLLSPAAASRLPAEYRAELLKEMQYPDPRDTLCRYHRGPTARVDPFAEAERELEFLTRAGAAPRPYPRAKSIGRYLHWVADGVVPAPIASGKVCEVLDFWANKDFVVYRERAPLARPLAASLRARAEAAAWADDGSAAMPSVFRQVVNTTIEALLLLPNANATAPAAAPDEGPVLFLVNRIDTGLSGMRSGIYYVESTYDLGGGFYLQDSGIAEIKSGGQGQKKADLMQRRSVQIAEQSVRTNPAGGVSIRALVFNNLKVSACGVSIEGGKWSAPVAGTLPPGALRLASFDVPPGVDPRNLKLTSRTSDCPATVADGTIRTDRRLVLGSTGAVPRLKAEEGSLALGGPAPRSSSMAQGQALSSSAEAISRNDGGSAGREGNALAVTVAPASEYGLGAPGEVQAMEVAAGPWEWKVTVTARNALETPLGQVRFVVARTGGARDETESIWVDMRKLPPGATQKFVVTHRPRKGGIPGALRLVDIRSPL